MTPQENEQDDCVEPYFLPISEVPPATFVAARLGAKQPDSDVVSLVGAAERLRDNGDDSDQHHDIWHTAHFLSKDNADAFIKWLDERAFCAISCCHVGCGGWLVSAFNYGFSDALDLIKWYSIVRKQVRAANGRYVEVRVRVMCDEQTDSV